MTSVPVQQSAKCETCRHGRAAHQSRVYLDSQFPGQAPHRTEHCTSCCDPEDANSNVCSHDFEAKSVAPSQSVSCWLVERRINGRAAWLHFDTNGFDKWAHDPLQADRFPNKASAAIIAGSFPYPEVVQATEHMFVGAPSQSVEEARARVGGSIALNTNRHGVPIMEWEGRDAELDALIEAVRREHDQ